MFGNVCVRGWLRTPCAQDLLVCMLSLSPQDKAIKALLAKHLLHTFRTGRGTSWEIAADLQAWLKEQQRGAWVDRVLFEAAESSAGGNDNVSLSMFALSLSDGLMAHDDHNHAESESGSSKSSFDISNCESGGGKKAMGSGKSGARKGSSKKGGIGSMSNKDASSTGAMEAGAGEAKAGTIQMLEQQVQKLFVDYSGFEELHGAMLAYVSVSKWG